MRAAHEGREVTYSALEADGDVLIEREAVGEDAAAYGAIAATDEGVVAARVVATEEGVAGERVTVTDEGATYEAATAVPVEGAEGDDGAKPSEEEKEKKE